MTYGAHPSPEAYVIACFEDHILEYTKDADEATKRAVELQSTVDWVRETQGEEAALASDTYGHLVRNNTMAVNERTVAEAYQVAMQAVKDYFGMA